MIFYLREGYQYEWASRDLIQGYIYQSMEVMIFNIHEFESLPFFAFLISFWNISVLCVSIRQRLKYVGSTGALLPGEFCEYKKVLNWTYFCLLFPELVWKTTEFSEKFLDCLESFQIVLNVSELSGMFQFYLKMFCIVWKV